MLLTLLQSSGFVPPPIAADTSDAFSVEDAQRYIKRLRDIEKATQEFNESKYVKIAKKVNKVAQEVIELEPVKPLPMVFDVKAIAEAVSGQMLLMQGVLERLLLIQQQMIADEADDEFAILMLM